MIERENSNALPPFWTFNEKNKQTPYRNMLSSHQAKNRPNTCRGGILADDMGLGKTLQIIALIATNKPGAVIETTEIGPSGWPLALPSTNASDDASRSIDLTLGDAPPAKKAKTGGARGRKKQLALAAAADTNESALALSPTAVTLTKREFNGAVTKDKVVGAVLVNAQDKIGATSSAPSLSGPKTTLIVCPLSVMSNWEDQIKAHTNGSLKVARYHGAKRAWMTPAFLSEKNVVITTYGTLHSEWEKGGMVDGSGDCDSSSKFYLGSVHYLRVVLDEAHNVKNPNAGQTQAVCALRSRGRWALSGTSIQNHLGDLQSLLNFIKLDPLDDREFWQRNVNRPVMLGDARGFDRLVTVVAAVALRRTKTQKLPDGRFAIELPDKRVEMCLVDLASADRTLYDRYHAKATGLVECAAREGEYGGNFFATIMEAILRLRQICCHSTLVTKEMLESLSHDLERLATIPNADALARLLNVLRQGGMDDCAICYNDMSDPAAHATVTPCAHVFCRTCVTAALLEKKACPLCRGPCAEGDLIEAPPPDDDKNGADEKVDEIVVGFGAKVDALVLRLRQDGIGRPPAARRPQTQSRGVQPVREVPECRAAGGDESRVRDGAAGGRHEPAAARRRDSVVHDGRRQIPRRAVRLPESRRRGHKPHVRELCVHAGPMEEPRGGGPGDGPGAPARADAGRGRGSILRAEND